MINVPDKLGRFDSIVNAAKTGDVEKTYEAVIANLITINEIIRSSAKTVMKYNEFRKELENFSEELELKKNG
jgi:hypothetical protein